MNNYFRFLLIIALGFFFLPDANSFVVDINPAAKKEIDKVENYHSTATKALSKKQLRKIKRKERKRKRLEKRLAKVQKKWEMKTRKFQFKKNKKKRRFFGGVSDEPRFKLGLILLVISILVGILSALPILGRIFGFISGVVGLVGIILILLALLEYY